jgi:hypothetical protein
VEQGEMYAGAASGMIHDVFGAGDVVKQIVEGYDRIVARLKEGVSN